MYRQALDSGSQPDHNLCEDMNDLKIAETSEDSQRLVVTQQSRTTSSPGPELRSNPAPFTEALLQSGSLIPPQHPCTSPLKDLKKISLKDLVFESHHRGFYLLARTTTSPDMSDLVYAMIEDEEGDTIAVLISHLPGPRYLGSGLKKGTVFIVKEPHLKWTTKGHCGIRVDHPSDTKYLSPYDELVPEKWRVEHVETPSFDTWRAIGNCHFNEENCELAIECYSKALEFSATEEDINAVKCERALSHFNLASFHAALSEFDSLPTDFELFTEALNLKAMTLYNLKKYRECTDTLKLCLKRDPQSLYANGLLSRAICRLLEQEQGKYKFKHMQEASEKLPIMDCATYIGPVQIGQTESRGRGLFTTKAVKAGDLLFCEKASAFAVLSAENTTKKPHVEFEQEVYRAQQHRLVQNATEKIFQNPSLLPILSDLHHGSYTPSEASFVDGAPVFDMFLIYRTVAFNSFAGLRSSRDDQKEGPMDNRMRLAGVWTLASHINHACYGNSFRSFIGDMLILRSAADIPENTEITFCYKPPEGDCIKGKPDHSFWGFKCDCTICNSIQSTDDDVLAERLKLRTYVTDSLQEPQRLRINRLNEDIAKIERTYSTPALTVPRLSVYDIHVAIAQSYARIGWPIHAIEFAFKALESLGFHITGGCVQGPARAEVVVQKWGIVAPVMVEIWMMLSRAYHIVEPSFEAEANKYAKLSYKILVGEDETFEETYENRPSSSVGPTVAGLVTELTEMGLPVDAKKIRRQLRRHA